MVALILTRVGLDDIRARIDTTRDAVWVNAGVLSPPEVAEVREAGWNLTTFANPCISGSSLRTFRPSKSTTRMKSSGSKPAPDE